MSPYHPPRRPAARPTAARGTLPSTVACCPAQWLRPAPAPHIGGSSCCLSLRPPGLPCVAAGWTHCVLVTPVPQPVQGPLHRTEQIPTGPNPCRCPEQSAVPLPSTAPTPGLPAPACASPPQSLLGMSWGLLEDQAWHRGLHQRLGAATPAWPSAKASLTIALLYPPTVWTSGVVTAGLLAPSGTCGGTSLAQ